LIFFYQGIILPIGSRCREHVLKFEWDPGKNTGNIKKHGLAFEDAAFVFCDPDAISIIDHKHAEYEERWITLGQVLHYGIIVVVHTDRIKSDTEYIRIISARKAVMIEKLEYIKRKGVQ
jgi:uncharacterized protein